MERGGCFKPVRLLPEPGTTRKGTREASLAVNRQVDGEVARFFKTQALEVHDPVAGEKKEAPSGKAWNRKLILMGAQSSGVPSAQRAQASSCVCVFRSEADAQGWPEKRKEKQ